MGKTLAEKIIGSHAKKDVSAGEIAMVSVDVCLTQDGNRDLEERACRFLPSLAAA